MKSDNDAYRSMFKGVLDAAQLNEVRVATQSGTPLGNDGFRAEIERVLQVKIGQTHRGRPVKR